MCRGQAFSCNKEPTQAQMNEPNKVQMNEPMNLQKKSRNNSANNGPSSGLHLHILLASGVTTTVSQYPASLSIASTKLSKFTGLVMYELQRILYIL